MEAPSWSPIHGLGIVIPTMIFSEKNGILSMFIKQNPFIH